MKLMLLLLMLVLLTGCAIRQQQVWKPSTIQFEFIINPAPPVLRRHFEPLDIVIPPTYEGCFNYGVDWDKCMRRTVLKAQLIVPE